MARMLLSGTCFPGHGSPTRKVSLGLLILADSAPIAMATLVVAPVQCLVESDRSVPRCASRSDTRGKSRMPE